VEVDRAELAPRQRVAPVAEAALGELHDVALVDQRHARQLVLERVLDRRAHQPLGALDRHRLDAVAGRVREPDLLELGRELFGEQLAEAGRVLGALLEFDARVDVLGVLAEDHHVSLLGSLDRARHAGEVADRAQAGVEVEDLAQRDVEAADPAADRRGQRALDPDQVVAELVQRRRRQPVAGLLERLLAGQHLAPRDRALAAVGPRDRGVEHTHRGRPDVGPDAVSLDERDDRLVAHLQAVLGHFDRFSHGGPGIYHKPRAASRATRATVLTPSGWQRHGLPAATGLPRLRGCRGLASG